MTETEHQPEEPAPPDEEAQPNEEAQPDEQRLQDLEADIEAVRQRVDDPIDQGDRRFVESGDEDPVDDTIAPPG